MMHRAIATQIATHLCLDAAALEERLRFLRFGPEDGQVLRMVHDRMGAVPPRLADVFYAHLVTFDGPRRFLERPGTLERLKRKQAAHFASMLQGPWDMNYALRRLEVGYAHYLIGIEPAWYVGAFSHYLLTLQELVTPLCTETLCVDAVHDALSKVVLLDMTLGLEAYHYGKYVQAQELERLALTDGLTGLKNRRALDRAVGQGAMTAGAVLFVDIDHFKAVNDRFGHDVGDAVLRALAGRLRQSLRLTDVVFRYGGEEYLVLLPGADAAGAREAGEKLRRAVAEEPLAGVACTVSVGGAVVGPGEDFWAAVRRADQAMYAAKAAGRNRVVVDESPDSFRDEESSGAVCQPGS